MFQKYKGMENVQDAHYDLNTMSNICGANNYFYSNRTIHFVVTGASGCLYCRHFKQPLESQFQKANSFDKTFQLMILLNQTVFLSNYFILSVKKSQRFLQQNVESASDDNTVTIAVAVFVSIVGFSLINKMRLHNFQPKGCKELTMILIKSISQRKMSKRIDQFNCSNDNIIYTQNIIKYIYLFQVNLLYIIKTLKNNNLKLILELVYNISSTHIY
ncbi:hypothetical protein pb186bvf_003049 [Paramecium bursaria]